MFHRGFEETKFSLSVFKDFTQKKEENLLLLK